MIHYWVIVVSSGEQRRKVHLHGLWYCCHSVPQTLIYPAAIFALIVFYMLVYVDNVLLQLSRVFPLGIFDGGGPPTGENPG